MSKTEITKIRVKVAISSDGKWYAYGYDGCDEDDADNVIHDMASGDDIVAWKMLTAEIEMLQLVEVKANVEEI